MIRIILLIVLALSVLCCRVDAQWIWRHTEPTVEQMGSYREMYRYAQSLIRAELGASDIHFPSLEKLTWHAYNANETFLITTDSLRAYRKEEHVNLIGRYSSSKGHGRFQALLRMEEGSGWRLQPEAGSLTLSTIPTAEELRTYQEYYDSVQFYVRQWLASDSVYFPALSNPDQCIGRFPIVATDSVIIQWQEISLLNLTSITVEGHYIHSTQRGKFKAGLDYVRKGSGSPELTVRGLALIRTPTADNLKPSEDRYAYARSLVRAQFGTSDVHFPPLGNATEYVTESRYVVETDSVGVSLTQDAANVYGYYISAERSGEFSVPLERADSGGWKLMESGVVSLTEKPSAEQMKVYRQIYERAQWIVRRISGSTTAHFPSFENATRTYRNGSLSVATDSVRMEWDVDGITVTGQFLSAQGSGEFTAIHEGIDDESWSSDGPWTVAVTRTPPAEALERYRQAYEFSQSFLTKKLGAGNVRFPLLKDGKQLITRSVNYHGFTASVDAPGWNKSLQIFWENNQVSVSAPFSSTRGSGRYEATVQTVDGSSWSLKPGSTKITWNKKATGKKLKEATKAYQYAISAVRTKLGGVKVHVPTIANAVKAIDEIANDSVTIWMYNTMITVNGYYSSAQESGRFTAQLKSLPGGGLQFREGTELQLIPNKE